jgi:hypothetical protein
MVEFSDVWMNRACFAANRMLLRRTVWPQLTLWHAHMHTHWTTTIAEHFIENVDLLKMSCADNGV